MKDSKHKPYTIPNSQVVSLHSKNVDQEYELLISLPLNYDESKKYPVLYLLDSNWLFSTATGIAQWLYTYGDWNHIHVPEMIVVGIGYPEGDDPMALRSRDMTPVEDVDFYNFYFVPAGCDPNLDPCSGGAPEFLKFITEELFPYIESNYNTDRSDRTIAGYSYGGLFPLYVLFKEPEAFARYIAISPSVWYKHGILFDYEQEYSQNHSELSAKLFISSGTEEKTYTRNISEGVRRLVEVLDKREYEGLTYECQFFEGEYHITAFPPSFNRGLVSVFKS